MNLLLNGSGIYPVASCWWCLYRGHSHIAVLLLLCLALALMNHHARRGNNSWFDWLWEESVGLFLFWKIQINLFRIFTLSIIDRRTVWKRTNIVLEFKLGLYWRSREPWHSVSDIRSLLYLVFPAEFVFKWVMSFTVEFRTLFTGVSITR